MLNRQGSEAKPHERTVAKNEFADQREAKKTAAKVALPIDDHLMSVAEWYAPKSGNIGKLRCLALEVKDWLLKNKAKADDLGNEQTSKGPWLVDPGEYTEDPDQIDLRLAGYRQIAWGTGLSRLLNLMITRPLLPEGVIPQIFATSEDAYRAIKGVTCYRSMAVHEELMGYKLSQKLQRETINLKDMAERFDFSPTTNPTKIRGGRLPRMTSFGLLHVKRDEQGHCAISIGAVGELFHREVFSPVLHKFIKPRLYGTKE
jgi:hypothetical protein